MVLNIGMYVIVGDQHGGNKDISVLLKELII